MLPCVELRKAVSLLCFLFVVRTSAQTVQPSFSSSDFGTVQVSGSAASTQTLSFQVSGTPTFQLRYHVDFSIGQPACSGGSCSITVSFLPTVPGVRADAVNLLDGNGNLLAVAFVHGIGSGAQVAIWPGVIETFAGTGNWPGAAGDNGPPTSANLGNPSGLAIDPAGNLYIADLLNQVVRRVSPSNVITTVAGSSTATALGDGGLATSASLNTPTAVAVDANGNLFIADHGNNRVRRVDAVTKIITTVAGNGSTTGLTLGDGGQATSAVLNGPTDVAVDVQGNLYIADEYDGRIRKVNTSGVIATIAGGGTPGSGADGLGNGGPAVNSQLSHPSGIALDAAGNLVIADTGNNLIRKIQAGIIFVLAGNGSASYSGDGGAANIASLSAPTKVHLDAAGDLYISDSGNSVVRMVNAAGVISTLAGQDSQFGYLGDGGSPLSAEMNNPSGLTLAPNGALYIADQGSRVVRVVEPGASSLTFGSMGAGAISSPQTLTFANIGSQNLVLSGLSVSGSFIQQSSGLSDCVLSSPTVAPGVACSVGVAAAPQGSGTLTGSLNYQTNSVQSASGAIPLHGTATSVTTALPSVSSTSATFLNQTSVVANPVQNVTLTNNGTSNLNIGSFWIFGINAGDFSIASTTCGSVLAANHTCTFAVTFAPSASGTRTATLELTDATTGSSAAQFNQSIFLTGSVAAGQFSFAPPALSFAAAAVNTATAQTSAATESLTVTVTNAGSVPLPFHGAALSGSSAFAFGSTTCGSTLAGSATCQVIITFTPTAAGTQTGTVSFADSSQTIALTGSGTSSGVVSGGGGGSGSSGGGSSSSSDTNALHFYPITPCRIADTRNSDGAFGGPILAGKTFRSFAVPNSACGVPANAVAYSLNVTAIPNGLLNYLTIWPAGKGRPAVSTLNSDGRVKANAAIVPAGTDGAVSVYVSDPSHVVLDIDGYFAEDPSDTGLTFVPVTPCRVVDTRSATGALGGPYLSGGTPRAFPMTASSCGLPSSARAYSLNITTIPHKPLRYLATWPTGQSRPHVSTLNAPTGTVTANAAIVPVGANGDISVYVTDDSDVIVDTNGYFAPAASGGLSLYTLQPCRVVDTRNVNGGAPSKGTLRVDVSGSDCGVPSTAEAYSMNATVLPIGELGFLSLWPDGKALPLVSTLNAYDGAISSNMAIVPAGAGWIDAYTSQASQVVLDISSYFAP